MIYIFDIMIQDDYFIILKSFVFNLFVELLIDQNHFLIFKMIHFDIILYFI